jgi:hypothetical protein
VGAHPAAEQLDDGVMELLVDRRIRSIEEGIDLAERRRLPDRLVRPGVAPVDEEGAARIRDDGAYFAEQVRPDRVIGQPVAGQDERDLTPLVT